MMQFSWGNVRSIDADNHDGLLTRLIPEMSGPHQKQRSVVHISLKAGSKHRCVSHKATSELIFIVAGSATGKVEEKRIRLKRGDFLSLLPRVRHEFTAGKKGVEAVCVFSPAMDEKYPDVVYH